MRWAGGKRRASADDCAARKTRNPAGPVLSLPSRQHANTSGHVLARTRHDLGIQREPDIHTRTEPDQPDPLSQLHVVAGPFPADHAPCDGPGYLLENHLTTLSLQVNYVLLVLNGRARTHRIVKAAPPI